MATLKELAEGRKDLFMVNPMIIQEAEGWNVRGDSEELDLHIAQLAVSIASEGVREPLTVHMKDGKPFLTDGHCRLKAVKIAIAEGAEIKTVPVRNEERTSNEADRTMSMLIRNSGKPLTTMEQAEVVKRLVVFGWDDLDISKRTGYSRSHIGNLIRLSGAPVKVQEMVKSGEVSATLANETLRESGEEKATEILVEAVEVAKVEGKKKATKRHVEGQAKAVNWKANGPELLSALENLTGFARQAFKNLGPCDHPVNVCHCDVATWLDQADDIIAKCSDKKPV